MKEAVGVRYRKSGKIYFFDPNNLELQLNENVIVETAIGKEFGTVVLTKRKIDETKLKDELKKVIKKADKQDIKHFEENIKKEKEALEFCKKKVKEHGLQMDLVEVRYLFDNSKLIFYFTSDNRVDFRDLVKDLAAVYRTRIELRQITIRDEVKRIGGLGHCGRELCCCTFLNDFDVVTIKMAKEQNLSLNAAKITGKCGRLMCCLKYEQNVYEDKMKNLPHVGAIVKTEEGEGVVESIEVLKELLKVKLKDEEGNNYYKKYNIQDVKIIKDTRKIQKEEENEEDIEELQKLEEMDKKDESTIEKDEI